jgi:hypothetical protein
MKRPVTSKELYKKLSKKYPNINYKSEEDLNIYRNTVRILRDCWHNPQKYRTIGGIVTVTGIDERKILNIAHDNGFENRKQLKSRLKILRIN